jgi:hypothetical protein
MITKTDQTSKEIKAESIIDQPNRSIVMAALLGTALVMVALIVFTALNGRVGMISQAANVQNSTDSIVTLGELHALESGYNSRGVTEAEADSIVSLGIAHALESGYKAGVQADNIITLDKWYALENGASLEAVIGSDSTAQPADSILSLPLLHALESGYTPKDSIITLGMVHALENGYNPGE